MSTLALIVSFLSFIVAVAAWMGYRVLWNREEIARMVELLERMDQRQDRMEQKTYVVALDLAASQEAVGKVAVDLAESQRRADQITEGEPGEAADAGAQSGHPTLF